MRSKREQKPLNSSRLLAAGFAAMILLGACVLALPAASSSDRGIGFMNALFTATSSVCVTGLSVIDVSRALSRFGQTVQLLLIQMGGLGFMVFGTFFFAVIGRRITLRGQLLLSESMNAPNLSGLMRLIYWVLGLTLGIELAGAALLAIRFVPEYGWGEGAFMSLYHAVSAFCNAGFDLFGSSLVGRADDPLVLFTLMALITLGGLGFALMADVLSNGRFSRLSVHTRLVLAVSAVLTATGCLLTLLLEWRNPGTLGAMPPARRLMNALFQSVTLRTAGFASFSQAALRPATKVVSMIYMFIGAAPASTGGGVKLTTVSVLVLMAVSVARGQEETTVFHHTVPRGTVQRAMTVVLIALAIVLADVVALALIEPGLDFINVMYEAVSAFGTAGLSCDLTPRLSAAGRSLIIATMFAGRVGPLTLALAIARRQSRGGSSIHYPSADIMIG